jgi:hypothetical protein
MKDPIIAAVVTAAISTVGDYLWANVLPHGRPVYWFAHAIVLFTTVGGCLGWPTGKPLFGMIGAVTIGCAATVGFYLLQPLIGYSALFVLFFGLWLALGTLTVRLLQRRDRTRDVLIRSAIAAVGSGLGFYAISGIWMPFDPRGWDYAVHFVSWIAAYLPAYAALLMSGINNQDA